MIVPTVHLNGTSRESLLDDLMKASSALEEAYQALKRTAPNGRDYYPQGPDAVYLAEGEHRSRLERLDSVKGEVDQLAVAVDRAGR